MNKEEIKKVYGDGFEDGFSIACFILSAIGTIVCTYNAAFFGLECKKKGIFSAIGNGIKKKGIFNVIKECNKK